jgi:DNA-directed RNA polymerase subunit N (RpoN/RPB10)|tara:strand:+ start:7 stop:267 length:261 start_codon:yes stop_codon:yes gene_type:complete
MIIPIRCFTCGNVVADKWEPFIKTVSEKKKISSKENKNELDIEYIEITDDGSVQTSIEGDVLTELGLKKYCCRRMMLGNVHLISNI